MSRQLLVLRRIELTRQSDFNLNENVICVCAQSDHGLSGSLQVLLSNLKLSVEQPHLCKRELKTTTTKTWSVSNSWDLDFTRRVHCNTAVQKETTHVEAGGINALVSSDELVHTTGLLIQSSTYWNILEFADKTSGADPHRYLIGSYQRLLETWEARQHDASPL